jgi:Fe-S cluster assembly protein SufD
MASSRAALHPPRSEEELKLIERFNRQPPNKAQAAAFVAFEKAGLPHRRVEGWRWSDVRAALRDANRSGDPKEFRGDPFADLGGRSAGFSGQGASFANQGHGVTIAKDHTPRVFEEAAELPLAALAVALSEVPPVANIEIAEPQSEPLRLSFIAVGLPTFRHLVVRVKAGVEAEVIETYLGAGQFTNIVLEFHVEEGAKLSRSIFQFGTRESVQVSTAIVKLAKGAHFEQTALGLGAKLARIETRVDHLAGGSEAVINGAYLAGAGKHVDFTSHVRHAAPHCTTRQTVKGVARERGKGVFQGKFLVDRIAQKTDAEMEHHALLLDEGAEVNAKPELEIYADDVACAHGNTVGALDTTALFYLRQRGIPLDEAQAMLIQGFIEEAFELASPKVREILMQEAQRWLLQTA